MWVVCSTQKGKVVENKAVYLACMEAKSERCMLKAGQKFESLVKNGCHEKHFTHVFWVAH
jgi:hypothetical protein